jgi:hypothetical protein
MQTGGGVLIILAAQHVQFFITLLALKDRAPVTTKRITFIILKEHNAVREHQLFMRIKIRVVCELIGFIALIGVYLSSHKVLILFLG